MLNSITYTHAKTDINMLQYDLPTSLKCENIPIKTLKNENPSELTNKINL